MPVTLDDPVLVSRPRPASAARVAVVRTRPETVLADYARVMDLAGCFSQPWQVDGVVRKMLLEDDDPPDSDRKQDRRDEPARGMRTEWGSLFRKY
jgi:hypothetical protein